MVTETEFKIAKNRIEMFNVKVNSLGKNIFTRDYKKEKELEQERQKLCTILVNKYGIYNAEELLLKPGE